MPKRSSKGKAGLHATGMNENPAHSQLYSKRICQPKWKPRHHRDRSRLKALAREGFPMRGAPRGLLHQEAQFVANSGNGYDIQSILSSFRGRDSHRRLDVCLIRNRWLQKRSSSMTQQSHSRGESQHGPPVCLRGQYSAPDLTVIETL
jgi:hypothetical protein